MTSATFPTAAAQGCKADSLASGLPTKHGFIHFSTHDAIIESQMRRCESCPADVALFVGALKGSVMPPRQEASHSATVSGQQAHDEGTCRPCAYFGTKADGCRQGADCRFCHLCPPEEFKRRKKDKLKRMKEEQTTMMLKARGRRQHQNLESW
eukprot:TRINITY_DN26442_c0_g1_i3.p1 TRINITY_DN26442_c0_g1~~TRINITY_DN26442_c0_g1_i3.p1  ORF type:complete len:177 (-),score=16.88 TRINITY_DN26442_c0_g1_i3:150-608(-)